MTAPADWKNWHTYYSTSIPVWDSRKKKPGVLTAFTDNEMAIVLYADGSIGSQSLDAVKWRGVEGHV